MSTEVNTLLEIISEYIGTSLRERSSALERHFGDTAQIASVVWEARKAGRLDATQTHVVGMYLASDPSLYDVDDYVRVLDDFALAFPDGEALVNPGASPWRVWPVREIEGWNSRFHDMLEAKLEHDPGFITELAARRDEVHEPVRTGLSYILASQGLVDWRELPEELIDTLARALSFRENPKHLRYITDYNPWPEDVWGAALTRVLLDPEVDHLANFPALARSVPLLADEDIPSVLLKGGLDFHRTILLAQGVAARGASQLGPLEDAIVAAPDDAWTRTPNKSGWKDIYGGFHLMVSYAGLCGTHGHTPDARIQPALDRFVEHFRFGWSGGGFADYCATLWGLLSGLPAEMFEEALLREGAFEWHLAGAIRSRAGVDAAIERLLDTSEEGSFWFDEYVATMCFSHMGADLAVAPLSDALLGGQPDDIERRVSVARILSSFEDARAAHALAHGLSDRSKKVREAAAEGLKSLPHDALIDALEGPLHASKKDTREAAASVLLAMDPSLARYTLASARLAKERAASVKAMLERIEPVDDGETDEPALDPTLVEAYIERISEGPRHLGAPQLADELGAERALRVYAAFIERKSFDFRFDNYWWDVWFDLLTRVPASLAVESAIDMAGYTDDSDKYLERLSESVPLAKLPQRLCDWLVEERFDKSPTAKETSGFAHQRLETPHAAKWLASNHPDAYPPLALARLHSKKKSERDGAIAFIRARPTHFEVSDFVELLDAKKAATREYGAHALGALGDPAARGALDARDSSEKSAKVKAAIAAALDALEA